MKQYRDVDEYLADSEQWPAEIAELRRILLDCGLTEQIKWGKPCFGHRGRNLVIVQQMKDFLALMFFKGALLDDPDEVLRDQGPNSRWARRLEFTSVEQVSSLADSVRRYIAAAIDVEDAGLDVGPPPMLQPVEELRVRLDEDAELRAAFDALTPGRQREYNLHVSDAKQSSTRRDRVERCVPKILDGKGLRDR